MGFGFEQAIGLLGLLVLIPFIVVYLIKPKPRKLAVPSLVFFMKKAKVSTKESLFRIFQKDYLFYIQLFAILFLAFSLSYPYFSMQRDIVSKNLVFVFDISASSQVLENEKTRFDIGRDEIKKIVGDKNAVILAKSNAVVALSDAGRLSTLALLNKLKPTDGESRIGDAMLLAGDILKGQKGRVVVVSDFINTGGVSVQLSEDILKSKGIAVDLIDVKGIKHNNIGIVDIIADEESTAVYARNYINMDKELELDIDGKAEKLVVPANNVEPFIYKTKEGISRFEIKNEDDFMADNIAWISNPAGNKIKVALITNYPSLYLRAALNSNSRIELIMAEPPILPKEDIDIYVIGKIDSSKILAGTYEDILKKVENGKSAVITAFDGIEKTDFKGLSNIKFNPVNITVLGSSVNTLGIFNFVRGVEFADIRKVHVLDSYEGEVLVEAGQPLIIYKKVGDKGGKIIYYGINDKFSSFQLSPDYPIFWSSLIKYLAGAKDMNALNLRTGMGYADDFGNELVLENKGVYNITAENTIAVNIINYEESDINGLSKEDASSVKISGFKFDAVKENVKENLLNYLLALALLLVVFEVYYAKKRGAV